MDNYYIFRKLLDLLDEENVRITAAHMSGEGFGTTIEGTTEDGKKLSICVQIGE